MSFRLAFYLKLLAIKKFLKICHNLHITNLVKGFVFIHINTKALRASKNLIIAYCKVDKIFSYFLLSLSVFHLCLSYFNDVLNKINSFF